jgi:putative membrane protein
MPLSEKERQQINTLVARFEKDTGAQAIAAVTRRADAYPEIPWKAYAFGSALGAVAAAFEPPIWSTWTQTSPLAFDALLILAAGAALAIASALVPAIARLFLDCTRMHTEALHYARSMFLQRELFATANRRAVLVLMCRFERAVIVLTDAGLVRYATPAELNAIADDARACLTRGDIIGAFELALGRIAKLLAFHGLEPTQLVTNEIADDVVTENDA